MMTPRTRALVLAVGLGCALLVLAALAGCAPAPPGPDTATAMVTPPVVDQVPEPAITAPTPSAAPSPVAPLVIGRTAQTPAWDTIAGRFIVPAVGLSVPLGTMSVSHGAVNPPTIHSAYLINGYGTPHGNGTAYVALHSGRGLDAAGNALFDIAAGAPTVKTGEVVIVDAVYYKVTDVRLVKKSDVVNDSDIWKQQDGRLVVFTCLQRPAGVSLQNIVIVAERVR
ncbi:hypothetical protein GALL_383470 [mine drainage metagenome]|uniref:Sortase family protein n=1 Tax=mine drainage metagenome TaxID=410659 RepID=A0A1J5Q9P9_9ZZZZ